MSHIEKSQAVLKQVAADQSGPMSGSPAIAAHGDDDAADPVVIWGKRVGRVIGYGLLIVLAINLATGWFF
jgi:hypothetical protein